MLEKAKHTEQQQAVSPDLYQAVADVIQSGKLKHLVLIPDGHRRWAHEHGLSKADGHLAGAKKVLEYTEVLCSMGLDTLSIGLVSQENLNRNPEEILGILNYVHSYLPILEKILNRYGYRFVLFGNRQKMPQELVVAIDCLEEKTKSNKKVIFWGIAFSPLHEIVTALQHITQESEFNMDRLLDEKFDLSKLLYTGVSQNPNVDLVIRFGFEQRLSGALPYQVRFAELFFGHKYFPDTTFDDLANTIIDFSQRKRRLGAS